MPTAGLLVEYPVLITPRGSSLLFTFLSRYAPNAKTRRPLLIGRYGAGTQAVPSNTSTMQYLYSTRMEKERSESQLQQVRFDPIAAKSPPG